MKATEEKKLREALLRAAQDFTFTWTSTVKLLATVNRLSLHEKWGYLSLWDYQRKELGLQRDLSRDIAAFDQATYLIEAGILDRRGPSKEISTEDAACYWLSTSGTNCLCATIGLSDDVIRGGLNLLRLGLTRKLHHYIAQAQASPKATPQELFDLQRIAGGTSRAAFSFSQRRDAVFVRQILAKIKSQLGMACEGDALVLLAKTYEALVIPMAKAS